MSNLKKVTGFGQFPVKGRNGAWHIPGAELSEDEGVMIGDPPEAPQRQDQRRVLVRLKDGSERRVTVHVAVGERGLALWFQELAFQLQNERVHHVQIGESIYAKDEIAAIEPEE